MQAQKPRDFPADLSPGRSVAASPVGGDCRNAALCPPAWTARGRGSSHALFSSTFRAYISICRRKPAMAINGRRNKPIGPGGSTRRLHQGAVIRSWSTQPSSGWTGSWSLFPGSGGEIGSTRA